MSNSVLTLNQYNKIKKVINNKYGGNRVIYTEDIVQEAYLKLLEKKHNILDAAYVINTAKYVVLNTFNVYKNHERLKPVYGHFLSISRSEIADRPDLILEYYKDTLEKHMDEIREAMAIPDKTRYILCITTGEVFTTSLKAAKAYNITPSMIAHHLSGKKKSAGKYRGLALQWKRLTKDN